jgi:hypothetical protein
MPEEFRMAADDNIIRIKAFYEMSCDVMTDRPWNSPPPRGII